MCLEGIIENGAGASKVPCICAYFGLMAILRIKKNGVLKDFT